MAKQLGTNGTNLIIGYEKEILKVYDDGFGYPTLGIGHLLTASEKKAMPLGTKITKEQSRAYFKADAQKYVDAVNKAVKVPITQNQFDALVSLAFNIGTGAIAKASLMRKLNARDYVGAADGFLAWNKVKGKAVKGLTRRRNEERKLFLTPDSAATSTATAGKSAVTSSLLDEPSVTAELPTNLEVTQTSTQITDGNTETLAVTAKNEQDVNEPAEVEGVRPYREIGLGGVLKNDAKAILPTNIGLNTISEWIQQTTGWPQWIADLMPKLVIVAIVCTALWLLYRVLTYLVWKWTENERVKLLATINANPRTKDLILK